VANPDNRLPDLLVELETRALALEQITATSLVILFAQPYYQYYHHHHHHHIQYLI